MRFGALAVAIALVACGGADTTLFGNSQHVRSSGKDAGGDARSTNTGGATSSAGGSGGGSSTGGGVSSGATGGGSVADGSTGAGGTRSDGSAGASGSDGAPPNAADSSAGGASTGGAVGNGGTTSTGGKSGAGGTATGTGGAVGQGPTAGVIACAGSDCTIAGTPTNVCCVGGLTPACLPSFPGCVQFGRPIACDDAADCQNGNICCASTTGASCAKNCGSGATQLCRTNDECRSGECHPVTATPEYSSCQ